VGLFYVLLKKRNGDARLLLLFAWNPLVIMETNINGHLDILMVFFVLLFLYFFFAEKWALAGISLGFAVLSKLIPIILAPIFILYLMPPAALRGPRGGSMHCNYLHGRDKLRYFKLQFKSLWAVCPVPAIGSLSGTIAIFYLWYWESAGNMFLTAVNYGTKWYFNNPLFMIILSIFNDNQIAHMVSFGIFILLYLLILFRKMEITRKFFYVLVLFIFLNPALHPWYLIILLAMLSIYRSDWIILWSGTVIAAYTVVYQFKLNGVWKDSWLIMAIEYVPVILLLVYKLSKRNSKKLKNDGQYNII
jgi:hypothetical protein